MNAVLTRGYLSRYCVLTVQFLSIKRVSSHKKSEAELCLLRIEGMDNAAQLTAKSTEPIANDRIVRRFRADDMLAQPYVQKLQSIQKIGGQLLVTIGREN